MQVIYWGSAARRNKEGRGRNRTERWRGSWAVEDCRRSPSFGTTPRESLECPLHLMMCLTLRKKKNAGLLYSYAGWLLATGLPCGDPGTCSSQWIKWSSPRVVLQRITGVSQEWNRQKLGDGHPELVRRSRGLSRAPTTSTTEGKTVSELEHAAASF